MHVIQILLPLKDNDNKPFSRAQFKAVQDILTARFGGVTTFDGAPAEGIFEESGERQRDQIVIFEIMAETLDHGWWRTYRKKLEAEFRQDEIVVRAHLIERL